MVKLFDIILKYDCLTSKILSTDIETLHSSKLYLLKKVKSLHSESTLLSELYQSHLK